LREETSSGERHGHNIIALDFNFTADTKHLSAPGGSYRADNLSCISCHDPHGRYRRLADGTISREGPPIIASGSYDNSPSPNSGSAVGVYRLLAGKGYTPAYLAGGFSFTADPPAAVAPSTYNRAETFTDTRVAYGSGLSEWCANCHANILNNNCPGARQHVSGNGAKLSQEINVNYNSYINSGDLTGNSVNSYTSMVPYELGTNDYAILKSTANNNGIDLRGPQTSANVMCLTCHRAHASGWDNMTRWNTEAAFIIYGGRYPGIDNPSSAQFAQGRTTFEIQKTFYDRRAGSFSPYQRSLCNKCHSRD
jgi:cytochrome c553